MYKKVKNHVEVMITLGESKEIKIESQPPVSFLCEQLLVNVPCLGFLKNSRIYRMHEMETIDEFHPTKIYIFKTAVILNPQSQIKVNTFYTGIIPPGYLKGAPYLIIFSFIGQEL